MLPERYIVFSNPASALADVALRSILPSFPHQYTPRPKDLLVADSVKGKALAVLWFNGIARVLEQTTDMPHWLAHAVQPRCPGPATMRDIKVTRLPNQKEVGRGANPTTYYWLVYQCSGEYKGKDGWGSPSWVPFVSSELRINIYTECYVHP